MIRRAVRRDRRLLEPKRRTDYLAVNMREDIAGLQRGGDRREGLPNPKYIVLPRDPVDRAISHYHLNLRRGRELFQFAAAIVIER